MISDNSRGGIMTPESPPPISQTPQAENVPLPASSQPSQPSQPSSAPHAQAPYSPAPYRYAPAPAQRPRERGNSHVAAWIIGGILGFLVLGGLVIALLVALVVGFFSSVVGQRELSATSTQTFAVSGTPSLVISDTAGNVTIQQGTGSQVTAQITKHAWGTSDAVAQNGLNSTTVDVSQSGNTITVNTQFSASYFDGGAARRTVDLLITVPAQANADVRLSAGNIDARQITGDIRLDASAGNVTTTNVTFMGNSRLNVGAGNITVDGAIASGAAVDVHVGTGNATLNLPSDTPARLTAATGVGNLTITGWQIQVTGTGLTGHSANGNLGSEATGTLTIRVGTGNVTLMSH